MKMTATTFALLLLSTILFTNKANSQNLLVISGDIIPAPAVVDPDAQTMSFRTYNNLQISDAFDASNPVILTIEFTRFAPNTAAPTGGGADLFDWTLECTANCTDGDPSTDIWTFTGTQNQAFPPAPSSPFLPRPDATVVITGTAFETDPSEVTSTFGVGMDVALVVPSPLVDQETQDNFLRSYTYTEALAPIELGHFSAKADGNDAILSWSTATESGFSHFDVESSHDGIEFHKVGEVGSKGDHNGHSSSLLEYQYVDKGAALAGSTTYYRLKVNDLDGSSAYSDLEFVEFNSHQTQSSIYPNPISAGDTFVIESKDLRNIDIYAATGKLIKQMKYNGENSTEITTSELSTGIYFVVINKKERKEILVK